MGLETNEKRSHTPKGQVARDRILRAAEPLFAARGFHGTSMRDMAEAADVPLATVVYHFARKEALYGAVLAAINAEVMNGIEEVKRKAEQEGESVLANALTALTRWSLRRPARVRLVMRELVDNPARVAKAGALPLAPVLSSLSALVLEERGEALDPDLAVLHFIGAVSYVVAARPTVKRIVGADRDREMMDGYEHAAADLAARIFGPLPTPTPTKPPPLPTATPTATPTKRKVNR
jgi:AcrR family transcriptional regulator